MNLYEARCKPWKLAILLKASDMTKAGKIQCQTWTQNSINNLSTYKVLRNWIQPCFHLNSTCASFSMKLKGNKHIWKITELMHMWWIILTCSQTLPQPLSYSTSSKNWRRKNMKKPMVQDEDLEVRIIGKRDLTLGKLIYFIAH